MGQADFHYAADAAPIRYDVRIDVFGDDDRSAAQRAAQIETLGFGARVRGPLAGLLQVDAAPLGDVVLIDIGHCGAAECAALAALDLAACRRGAQIVVVSTIAALDMVFACLDQCRPQILVDPSPGDRVVAIGRALVAARTGHRVREMDEAERAVVLRLAEEVARIADRLDGLASQGGTMRVGAAGQDYAAGSGGVAPGGAGTGRAGQAILPEPRIVRQIIRHRQARARFFDADLFADPAWDILLDLTAARGEGTRVSVTSLCIASGVPPTTALRWIGQMTEAGLLLRMEDEVDRRRVFIALSDRAAGAMAGYFAELGPEARFHG